MKLFLRKNEFFLLLISGIFLCVFFVLNAEIAGTTEAISCFSRDLLCCYLVCLIIVLHKYVRYVSCIMIFIAGFILFNCSRIILSYFDIEWLKNSDKYIFYTFDNSTIIRIISLLGLSICSVIIGYLTRSINSNKEKHINCLSISTIDYRIERILKILIVFCVPGLIYKSFYDLYLIKTYGYLILFMDFPPAPFFARMSWGFFNILFPLLFMFSPNKKEYKKYILFYFVVSSISFLKGSRTTLLAPVLFFVWYYFALYSKKDLSLKKIVFALVTVAFIVNTMLLVRGTENVELNVFTLLFLLLKTQGVTYVFIGNYLDYAYTFVHQSLWYILYPLVSTFHWFFTPIYRQGQSLELVQHTLSLDDQLMYSIAPDLYLQGVGYGSSYVAELHALGGALGVVLGSFILGYAIKWFELNCLNNKILLYFSWFAIPYLVRLSRDNFVPNFFMFIIGMFIYFILKSFVQYRMQSYKINNSII